MSAKVAIAVTAVVLAVCAATAVVLVMRNADGGRTTAATTSASRSTTSPSPPPTKGRIDYSCLAMTNSSLDATTAINGYVDAFNATGEEQAHLADTAVAALDSSARRVELTIGPGMPAQLHDVLKGYTNATREVSGVISRRAAEEEFNSAIEHFNSAKTAAVDQCDALS